MIPLKTITRATESMHSIMDQSTDSDGAGKTKKIEKSPVNETNDGYGIAKAAALATPGLGAVVAAREAKRSWDRGDVKDAVLAASEGIPIVGMATGLLREKTQEDFQMRDKLRETALRTGEVDPKVVKEWQIECGKIYDGVKEKSSIFAKIDYAIMGKPGELGPLPRLAESAVNTTVLKNSKSLGPSV